MIQDWDVLHLRGARQDAQKTMKGAWFTLRMSNMIVATHKEQGSLCIQAIMTVNLSVNDRLFIILFSLYMICGLSKYRCFWFACGSSWAWKENADSKCWLQVFLYGLGAMAQAG